MPTITAPADPEPSRGHERMTPLLVAMTLAILVVAAASVLVAFGDSVLALVAAFSVIPVSVAVVMMLIKPFLDDEDGGDDGSAPVT
jgi:membrane protein YdbS with pleckstrin-like domain